MCVTPLFNQELVLIVVIGLQNISTNHWPKNPDKKARDVDVSHVYLIVDMSPLVYRLSTQNPCLCTITQLNR
jgi:hypothetical protein